MDTNLLTLLLQTMAAKQPASDHTSVMLVLAALTPTLMALVSFLQSRSTKAATDEVKKATDQNSSMIREVHVLVDGGRTEMTAEIKRLQGEIAKAQEIKELTKTTTVPVLLSEAQLAQIVAAFKPK